ncbi:MAG: S8 family serine peptidase, partial [Candidatus Bilamarchaeaceae archaeon]
MAETHRIHYVNILALLLFFFILLEMPLNDTSFSLDEQNNSNVSTIIDEHQTESTIPSSLEYAIIEEGQITDESPPVENLFDEVVSINKDEFYFYEEITNENTSVEETEGFDNPSGWLSENNTLNQNTQNETPSLNSGYDNGTAWIAQSAIDIPSPPSESDESYPVEATAAYQVVVMDNNFVTLSYEGSQEKVVLEEEVFEKLENGEKVRALAVFDKHKKPKGKIKSVKTLKNSKYTVVEIEKDDLKNLLDERVKEVYLDKKMSALLFDSVPLIGADRAVSELNYSGQGVSICLLDTGVDPLAIGLEGKVVGGYDFVNDDNDASDDNGHGTVMAQVISSVAPNATIIPVKVLSSDGTGYSSDIIEGINYCIDNAQADNIRVISMSFGGGSFDSYCTSEPVAESASYAFNYGIVPLAASGNDGTDKITAPACGREVVAIGATTKDDEIASFSNINGMVDLLAPGQNIYVYGNAYSGTSISTAHAAGAFALLLSSNISLSPSQSEWRLKNTGKLIEYEGMNYSRVDVLNAILNNQTGEPTNQTINETNQTWNYTYAPLTTCSIITSDFSLANNLTGAPITVLLSEVSYQVAVCILINGSNLTLDCGGYSITNNGTFASNGAAGVLINGGLSNVTIKNCVVSNYTFGIATYKTENSTILNNTVFNNSQYGAIFFYNSRFNKMENNTAYNNTLAGLASYYLSSYNNITGNTIYNSTQDGIYLGGSSVASNNNYIYNNTIFNTGRYGIYVDSTHNNTIDSNLVYYNMNNAIALGNAQNNTIANNTLYDGNISAISLSYSLYNKVFNNTAYNYTKSYSGTSAGYVLYLTSTSHYNNISYNKLYNGRYAYVLVGSSSNNILSYNYAENMTVDGYAIGYGSSNNTLMFNNAINCSEYGFHFYLNASNNTMVNNTAYFNKYGIGITSNATLSWLSNNTIHSNNLYGLLIDNGTYVYVENDHYYNNKNDIRIVRGPLVYNLSKVIIDNPNGNFENYTVLSLDDSVGAGEEYYINWSKNSTTLPSNRFSFASKFVDISILSGAPSIDSITWHWLDSELTGYNESKFELWKYNSSGWTMLNNTPDISNNVLSLTNMNPASTYGILQNNESTCVVINESGVYILKNNITGAPYNIYLSDVA